MDRVIQEIALIPLFTDFFEFRCYFQSLAITLFHLICLLGSKMYIVPSNENISITFHLWSDLTALKQTTALDALCSMWCMQWYAMGYLSRERRLYSQSVIPHNIEKLALVFHSEWINARDKIAIAIAIGNLPNWYGRENKDTCWS